MFRDDFERFAHDVICTVLQGARGGRVPQWQLEKVADMLRAGPGVTIWPHDAKEAAQQARERTLRRPVVPKVVPPVLVLPKVPPLVIPPAKMP